jgi:hypothetical protein
MAQMYRELSDRHRQFIGQQKLFFVGTATADSRINVSPKGADTLRVIDARRIAWLNLTGSGNETAAHVRVSPRMTLMFCAFEGAPLILRVYGTARAVHRNDAGWAALAPLFGAPGGGARQIFDLAIESVQTSCGMGVPLYAYEGSRGMLEQWAVKKGEEGVRKYWEEKNQFSIDGIPTGIVAGNF